VGRRGRQRYAGTPVKKRHNASEGPICPTPGQVFSPAESAISSSGAQAPHFKARPAVGQNHPSQMVPNNPESP
jgi:hypothetical protein